VSHRCESASTAAFRQSTGRSDVAADARHQRPWPRRWRRRPSVVARQAGQSRCFPAV